MIDLDFLFRIRLRNRCATTSDTPAGKRSLSVRLSSEIFHLANVLDRKGIERTAEGSYGIYRDAVSRGMLHERSHGHLAWAKGSLRARRQARDHQSPRLFPTRGEWGGY